MKKLANFKLHILILAVILLLVGLLFCGLFIRKHSMRTEIEYCKDIIMQLDGLNLEEFRCIRVDRSDGQHTQFYFRVQDQLDDTQARSWTDFIEIREALSEYLEENPSNQLNNDLIICTFEVSPGNCIYMYNYNFQAKQSEQQPDGFFYYKNLFVELSKIQGFSDAYIIDATLDEPDSIYLLSCCDNLQYLTLSGKGLPEEKYNELISMLPECHVTYNGVDINGVT